MQKKNECKKSLGRYIFEIWDITSMITVINVILIVLNVHWAPILGVINCVLCTFANLIGKSHINAHITQIALLIMNLHFLGVL